MKFFRGCAFGIVLAIPMWAVIIFAAVALAGCARPQPMGEGLWKVVKHVQERR